MKIYLVFAFVVVGWISCAPSYGANKIERDIEGRIARCDDEVSHRVDRDEEEGRSRLRSFELTGGVPKYLYDSLDVSDVKVRFQESFQGQISVYLWGSKEVKNNFGLGDIYISEGTAKLACAVSLFSLLKEAYVTSLSSKREMRDGDTVRLIETLHRSLRAELFLLRKELLSCERINRLDSGRARCIGAFFESAAKYTGEQFEYDGKVSDRDLSHHAASIISGIVLHELFHSMTENASMGRSKRVQLRSRAVEEFEADLFAIQSIALLNFGVGVRKPNGYSDYIEYVGTFFPSGREDNLSSYDTVECRVNALRLFSAILAEFAQVIQISRFGGVVSDRALSMRLYGSPIYHEDVWVANLDKCVIDYGYYVDDHWNDLIELLEMVQKTSKTLESGHSPKDFPGYRTVATTDFTASNVFSVANVFLSASEGLRTLAGRAVAASVYSNLMGRLARSDVELDSVAVLSEIRETLNSARSLVSTQNSHNELSKSYIFIFSLAATSHKNRWSHEDGWSYTFSALSLYGADTTADAELS
ncbi:MAG: hypothetical protein KKF24_12850, partial [Gammaproteobacteria bacterium]|nr:hypothetical protein [Gammaproteobacteria bacterium]MBU1833573.1 hypothetical protein [Gammaproteobacteria bacterium]